MKQFLLGIDIGTSGCKVVLFDYEGNVVAAESEAYKTYYPALGRAEHNPEDWYNQSCMAIKKILSKHKINASDIAAIGVDGISWTPVAVDKNGNAPYAPIWTDTRSTQECEQIKSIISEHELFELSGNPLSPTYCTPKILWLKRNQPDIYKQTHRFLQCNSYIVYRLTEQFSQDKSQGYGYHFFDIKRGQFDFGVAERLGIDCSKLPTVVDCDRVVGCVTNRAADESGLRAGTPVVAGGLDAACAALGAGVVFHGQAQEQGGQAGGMSICTDTCITHNRLITGAHVVSGKWLLQGGTVGGGASMRWLREVLGGDEFEELVALADKVVAGSDGMIFLPYLCGERSPIWDTKAKAVFYNMSFSTTRGHIVRAVLEGVAYSLRHNLETAIEGGIKTERLISVGGASQSRLWTQIKADVTDVPIDVPQGEFATALGAAMIAGVGVGVYKDYSEAINRTIRIKSNFIPNKSNRAVYDKAYNSYIQLYKNLKKQMNEE